MILLGHLAGSYLLAQIPAVFGHPLPILDQTLIVIAGNILDLDLLFSKHLVKTTFNHHYSPTHTIPWAILIYTIYILFFGNSFSIFTKVLILISLIFHLALDDVSYWFTKFGLEKSSPEPQIFWLFPFDHRRDLSRVPKYIPMSSVLKNYYFNAPWTFGFELLLSFIAISIFIYNQIV